MGNLFCRSCGVRLDMKNVEEQLKRRDHGVRALPIGKVFKALRQLVGFALLILVVAVLFGLFLPVEGRMGSDLAAEQKNAALQRLTVLVNREMERGSAEMKYRFTAAEVTALANHLLGLDEPSGPAEAGGVLVPENMTVELLGSGYVRLVLRSRTFKDLKVFSTLVGRFDVGEQGVRFNVYSARMGRVPMPGPLKQVVVGRFTVLVYDDQFLNRVSSRITALEVSKDQVAVTVGAPR
jgi:hypothetical protein